MNCSMEESARFFYRKKACSPFIPRGLPMPSSGFLHPCVGQDASKIHVVRAEQCSPRADQGVGPDLEPSLLKGCLSDTQLGSGPRHVVSSRRALWLWNVLLGA